MFFDEILNQHWRVVGAYVCTLIDHRLDEFGPAILIERLRVYRSEIMTAHAGFIHDLLTLFSPRRVLPRSKSDDRRENRYAEPENCCPHSGLSLSEAQIVGCWGANVSFE